MNSDLIALAEKRGELKARIAMQRDALAQNVWPVENLLGLGDRAVDGVHWMKRHPGAVGVAVLALVVTRPRRAWRWARRGFVAWRSFHKLRDRLRGVI